MRRPNAAAISLTLVVALSLAAPASAAGPTAGSVDPGSVTTVDKPAHLPLGLNGSVVDVVVRLKGQSAAEVQASLGRRLTKAEDTSIARSLKVGQDAQKRAIARSGGKVVAQFQHALDGMRVRIAADKVGQLASLPGVLEILPVQRYTIDNSTSVPYIGAPAVWNGGGAPNLHGEGIKIGIIDTGIDYTHANFGGPGTPAAFAAAQASATAAADPALFGPGAPKVKGGIDLVGDAYSAGVTPPVPDPNPLDCNGHGSHVAGTAAGLGVNADGSTYTGPYNAAIYTPGAFRIGPGVAPKADLYAIRVFGCSGSTDVVVDALDWAVKNHMDVVNMSLGSPFGSARTADAVAVDNATRAGVVVVTSAGNSGPNPYIVGSPSSADGAISVAASDPYASFPGATLALSTGVSVSAIDANGAVFADGSTFNVLNLVDNPATPVNEALGCNASDYPATIPANTAIVVLRGVCARVHKAVVGQKAGAGAVIMVNTAAGLPPYEGVITSDPDTGEAYVVTIPFFGVASAARASLAAADAGTLSATSGVIPNPTFSAVASFSSGGPRIGDSDLKPEITAPGVSTYSTLVGSGNQGEFLSGTSMAAPHVTGVAALVKQAHPKWTTADLKAAIVDTGNPDAIAGYTARSAGSGLVQPYGAVQTGVVAMAGHHGEVALNFGFEELQANLKQSRELAVSNHSAKAVTFSISVTNQSGVPHTLTPAATTVKVGANREVDVNFTLRVPAATAGNSDSFSDAAGIITLTPVSGGNNGIALHVPYYLVPRPLSALAAKAPTRTVTATAPSTTVTITNKAGAAIAGNADFYAWGLHSASVPGNTTNDVRDVGVQAFQNAGGTNNPLLVFGVNTYQRASTPVSNEFDISVDVDPQNSNGDDYIVFSSDYGLVTTGALSGQYGTFVYSLRSGTISALNPANTFAPTDSSSVSLAILGSQLCRAGEPCLNASNPRFTYHIAGYELFGTAADVVPGVATFNAYLPSISTGAYLAGIAPGTSASTPISIDPTEWASSPALGVLVLGIDNKSGAGEALEVPLTLKP